MKLKATLDNVLRDGRVVYRNGNSGRRVIVRVCANELAAALYRRRVVASDFGRRFKA